MKSKTNESIGDHFSEDKLKLARDLTLELIIEAKQQIKVGMSESEARSIINEIQIQKGSSKSWHPAQIRFGENSIHPFGVLGDETIRLKENDIFFLDLGPIFHDHEGDVGRTFFLGSDKDFIRCSNDVEIIWNEVRDHWFNQKVSGPKLYEFAKKRAEIRGWVLSLQKANGHRIADFPHIAKMRGSIEEYISVPSPNRWILEIQIRHPIKKFGAFYEDLLV